VQGKGGRKPFCGIVSLSTPLSPQRRGKRGGETKKTCKERGKRKEKKKKATVAPASLRNPPNLGPRRKETGQQEGEKKKKK